MVGLARMGTPWAFYLRCPTVTVVLIACVIVGWLLRVRPEAVRLTADRYARYLLEAACDLEPK